MILRRLEQQGIAEIQVERHDRTAFVVAPFNQLGIGGAGHSLTGHGSCVVACGLKQFSHALPEIFVQFKLQDLASIGTSTKRSRAISAPYAMQAMMSALSSCG
jgi:hypothetical protein